jgi:hypothetical protein
MSNAKKPRAKAKEEEVTPPVDASTEVDEVESDADELDVEEEDEEESSGDEVTVQYQNQQIGQTTRVFSRDIHGAKFKDLARMFAEKTGGKVLK